MCLCFCSYCCLILCALFLRHCPYTLQELRTSDYLANRKGPQAGAAAAGGGTTSLFGAASAAPATQSTGFGGFGAAAQPKQTFGGK